MAGHCWERGISGRLHTMPFAQQPSSDPRPCRVFSFQPRIPGIGRTWRGDRSRKWDTRRLCGVFVAIEILPSPM